VNARIRSTWVRLGLLSAVVLAIVAVVGMVFARGVTRPVRRLQRASSQLAGGDLTARVEVDDGPPELRALADTFNRTAEQLALLVDSQRRFVADASHQLRTPLTALRLRLETLGPFVSEQAQPKLSAAIAETNRLARLVHSLLVLARSDATTTTCEPVDLSAVVAERVDAWAPVAADQSVHLVADCPPDRWVLAVPGALEQILDNLVSNALEVAPESTRVTIRVSGARGETEVHVIDEGPGMDAEARASAFERFWKAPSEPGVGTGSGFGLGLAIVSQLATHSAGHARLQPGSNGRGLDAVVAVPSAPSPGRNGAPPAARPLDSNAHRALTSG
jgi:signal transduction histidine kinase